MVAPVLGDCVAYLCLGDALDELRATSPKERAEARAQCEAARLRMEALRAQAMRETQ